MNKIRVLIKAPILTQSGYGQHSRMCFDALSKDPMFDIFVEPLNWGQCSWTTEETPLIKSIKECCLKKAQADQQGFKDFDLFLHITIPNEFERLAKVNIGITAGIETDRVSANWVQKCNEMDLIIVPSEHSRKTLVETIVDWENKQTGQRGSIQVTKPVVVCSEGIDTALFSKKEHKNLIGLELESEFNFLHVGQWGHQGYGEDRKNIAVLIKTFIETFHGRKDVGLVLKVSMARNSMMDYDAVVKRIEELKKAIGVKKEMCPPIYLLHANLTEEEMADLYNHPKIKSFITLTHGERIWNSNS